MVTPVRQPDRTDKILMKFYDEFNMILSIYNEEVYDVYEKVPNGTPKYLGPIEKKVILQNNNFKQWYNAKRNAAKKQQ